MSKLKCIFLFPALIAGLVVFTFARVPAASAQVVAQEPPVEIEVDPAQIQSLLREIEQASLNEVSEEFIKNIVENPQDEIALRYAREAISAKLNASMNTLSDVRQIIYRYLVVSSRIADSRQLGSITANYSSRASALYSTALESLIPNYEWVSGLMNRCATELCLSAIDHAAQDLIEFVRRSDQNLNVENSNRSMKLFWDFKDPLLRVSLKDTLRKVLPPNRDHNLYKAVVAYMLSPLSLPVQSLIENGRKAAIAIGNPQIQIIQLDIARPNISLKGHRRNLSNVFSSQISAVISGDRAVALKAAAEKKARDDRDNATRVENQRVANERYAREEEKRQADAKAAEEKKAADEAKKKADAEKNTRIASDKARIRESAYEVFSPLRELFTGLEAKNRKASRSSNVGSMVEFIRSVPVKTLFREDAIKKMLKLSDLEIAQVLSLVPYGKCLVRFTAPYYQFSIRSLDTGYEVDYNAYIDIIPEVPSLVRVRNLNLDYNRIDWKTIAETTEAKLPSWDRKQDLAKAQAAAAAYGKRSREMLTEIGKGLRVAIQNEACSAGVIPQAWACTSKCGGYKDGQLETKSISSEGRSRKEAWDDLKAICDADRNHLYTKLDSKGSLNVAETTEASVCFSQ